MTERVMSLRFKQAQHVRTLSSERGRVWCWRVDHGVYATEVEGHLDAEMARLLRDAAEPMYALGTVDGFHNWLDMTSYATQARVELTEWALEYRAKTQMVIGVRSKLVAMGISVANLALGNLIRVHTSAEALEADLDRRLREPTPKRL
jgi:hypothetical protein